MSPEPASVPKRRASATTLAAWLFRLGLIGLGPVLPAAAEPAGPSPPPPGIETVVGGMVDAPAAAWARGLAAALALEPPATARRPASRAPSPALTARRSGRIAGAALLAYVQAARAGTSDARTARAGSAASQLMDSWRADRRRARLLDLRARAVRAALDAGLPDGLGLARVLDRLTALRNRALVDDRTVELAAGPGSGIEALPLAAAFGGPFEAPVAAPLPADGLPTLPVAGTLVQRFGQIDRGLRSRGVAFQAGAAGRVMAPSAGRVVFAGPFRSLGLLLIIGHGDGYHTLLSGMARLDVHLGEMVERGQPVGLMAVDGSGSNRLYMELRRSGEPIDPMPSLATREDKVRG